MNPNIDQKALLNITEYLMKQQKQSNIIGFIGLFLWGLSGLFILVQAFKG